MENPSSNGDEVVDPLLTAASVEVCLGRSVVLQDLSFALGHHEFVSVVGPSGCGKTTILRLIGGLETPSSGKLTISGEPRMAYVFQESNLMPWRTVDGNIALPLELQRVPRERRDAELDACVDLIGLSEADRKKLPRMLSGGMRMRVSLARALITRPQILLLDEPFAALDDMLRQRLNEELLRMWSHQRWAALFVTHNVAEAVFLSQRVLIVGGSPARVHKSVSVPFTYPRLPALRGDPEFGRLTLLVSELLRDL